MAKVTLVFAVLLIALGLIGYLGTDSAHPTALIPTWFGIAFAVFGALAMSPKERRRKLFMHVNVSLGLLGYLMVMVEIVRNLVSGKTVDATALLAKTTMAWLLLIYIILCVRSFRRARRSGKV